MKYVAAFGLILALQGCSFMALNEWNEYEENGQPRFSFYFNGPFMSYYASEEVMIERWVKKRGVCESFGDKYEITKRDVNAEDNSITVYGRCLE